MGYWGRPSLSTLQPGQVPRLPEMRAAQLRTALGRGCDAHGLGTAHRGNPTPRRRGQQGLGFPFHTAQRPRQLTPAASEKRVVPGPPDEKLPYNEETRQEATARSRSNRGPTPARKLKLHPWDYNSQRRQSFSHADKARCAFYQPTRHRKTAADWARRPITRKEAGAPPAGPGSVVES